MSHGVAYFAWRDGMPRWTPGPDLRRAGARAVCLKDRKGRYLPLELALEAARSLNANVATVPRVAKVAEAERKRERTRPGYIYFLRCGAHVKIGYSNNWARRARELGTGSFADVTSIVAIGAEGALEGRVHAAFDGCRVKGEWFEITSELSTFIVACVHLQNIDEALSGLRRARTANGDCLT